jgi:hypothetical protein
MTATAVSLLMESAMRALWQSGFNSHNIFFLGRE